MSAALYQSTTTANAWVELGPISAAGAFLLNIANNDTATDTVQVALMPAAGSPTAANLIEAGAVIPPGGVLSRWPLPLDVGYAVYVKATSANCAATLSGRVGA